SCNLLLYVHGEITCGQANEQCTPGFEGRVIGGECANPGQFPWVTVVDLLFLGLKFGFCGGAILDNLPIPILPGIPVQQYNITIGERNVTDATDGQQSYLSTRAIVHPGYKSCSNSEKSNNIALLKIDGNGMNVPYFTDNGLGSTNSICKPSVVKDYTGLD
ncbi:hypothetical protein B4U80_14683, partial [Leptotrombidium deliense]